MADQYPSASVVGTDLSPIQPKWVPVNVRMYVDDCEEPDWLHGSNFDMVHFRGMAGTLRDLDRMLKRTYPYVLFRRTLGEEYKANRLAGMCEMVDG